MGRAISAVPVAIVGTFVILKVLDAVMGLRVTQQEEIQGLDISQHGEEGYNLDADLGTSVMGRTETSAAAFAGAPVRSH